GDGETSRDFCYVDNAVQANLLAAMAEDKAVNQVYNVAYGGRTTLNQLFDFIKESLGRQDVRYELEAAHADFRAGDVRHSQADIGRARRHLGYQPRFDILLGIDAAMPWYVRFLR
ncbi:MAG: NAD-dependent epimerase/dehydratase family protein, partial [Bordetella sp.]|nr:NAD-dependent epimerase/dehydratase family protein [Bordetella sp.]